MSTKTWTNTADFSNASNNVYLDNAIKLRHQGCADGSAWDTTHHPDTSAETLSRWLFTNSGGATGTASFASSLLVLNFKSESDAAKKTHYWRGTKANILKSSTFSIGTSFKVSSIVAFAVEFGLQNSANDDYATNAMHFYVNSDGSPGFTIADSSSTTDTATGSASTIVAGTRYWLRIRGNGTNITADVYSTAELYTAASTGDVAALSVAVADISGTVTCNRIGFHNCNVAASRDETWTVYFVDGDVCDWYEHHQGARDGGGFNSIDYPDATGETKSGWTETLAGGASSAVTFSDGKMQIVCKSENSTSKDFLLTRPTNANVLKSTSFEATWQMQINTSSGVGQCTFVGYQTNASTSGEDSRKNAMVISLYDNAGTVTMTLRCYDSAGTEDTANDAVHTLSRNTDYWFKLVGNGTTIAAKAYTSLENLGTDTAYASCSVNVADISGTITATHFGIRNFETAGLTLSQTNLFGWFHDNQCTWYTETKASLADNDFTGLSQVDYSTFTGTVSSGTALYDIRKKETEGGSYTAYTNSGSHYTLAEIQALEDEDLYGLGFVVYVYPTETANQLITADAYSVDYTGDTTAPSDLDYLRVYIPSDRDWYVTAWEDAEDETDLSHNEMRISTDGGETWKYVNWDDTNHKYELATDYDSDDICKFLNPDTTKTADVYDFGTVVDVSELGLEEGTELTISMRGVDASANAGGWVTATPYAAGTGNVKEILFSGGKAYLRIGSSFIERL